VGKKSKYFCLVGVEANLLKYQTLLFCFHQIARLSVLHGWKHYQERAFFMAQTSMGLRPLFISLETE
jgi:hypothetical protein